MRLRHIDKLAEELEKTPEACIKLLASKSICVISGYYDAALFEATAAEPQLDARRRVEWGLSDRLGLGAIKALLDPLGVRITIHDPRGPQWLMLRRGAATTYLKWQYANALGKHTGACTFSIRNFLRENAPTQYLLTCFEGPYGWVLPAKALKSAWESLIAGEESDKSSMFKIPKGFAKHEGGALMVRMDINATKYTLKDVKQLGL